MKVEEVWLATRRRRIDPSLWASKKPFGIGEQRPNNHFEIAKAAWQNRDRLAYAWRILDHGVCDGCALGTSGMHDWTLDEIHLCNIRLRLLRLNTMPALDPAVLSDVSHLRSLHGRELRELGRLPHPMLRRRGDLGFSRVTWGEALELIAASMRATSPDRLGFYMTSRGMPNENYYAAQKAVRAIGTNSIDNAARVCHSPSTFGLKEALGVAATTCSYRDWIGSDLVVFIGSNVANNQPVAMKYLHHARKAGTKVVVVNPYREPGMERYWVPSNLESAVFGTRITDRFFQVAVGGDIAFLNGTLKHMIESGWVDDDFVERHTTGFDGLRDTLGAQSWSDLELQAGLPADEMREFAEIIRDADTAVLVWSMGITQHQFGEDAVRSIINLGLSKGYVGRPHCGLMPIRGHSGVQGGAEMGAYATGFPGGVPIDETAAAALSEQWGFDVPSRPGLTAPQMLDSAHDSGLDVLFAAGGNFLEVLPEPDYVEAALGRIPLRVHMDIVVSSQMLVDPADTVVLLPAQTRYEMAGGCTETSSERRVIFSPEIRGPRIAEARPEWRVLTELAARVRPERGDAVHFDGTPEIRREIARVVPFYEGIQHLAAEGDQFQYGGPHLCWQWNFPTPDRKARFSSVSLPERDTPEGRFTLTTRRGKQFNSMVHEDLDPISGASRHAVLIAHADAHRLGIADGDPVVLRNDIGELRGAAFLAPLAPGTLQVHWPEAEVLIDHRRRSPQAGIPDYTAVVELLPDG